MTATVLMGVFYRLEMPVIKGHVRKAYALGVMRLFQARMKFGFWRSRHGMKLIAVTFLGAGFKRPLDIISRDPGIRLLQKA